MQKKFIVTYLVIFATLLIMMSLSRQTSEKIRGNSVSLLAPFWEKILSARYFLLHPFQPSPFSSLSVDEEKNRLQLENQLLQTEISYLQKQLDEHLLVISQAEQMASNSTSHYDQKTFQSHLNILNQRLQAVPARVIFRSFDTWQHCLWINVGDETPFVSINSPVVIGRAIVGIIDYVGKNQSRVRLLTDHRLTPSVRVLRGGEQDLVLNEQIENLLQQLTQKKQLPLSQKDRETLCHLLKELKKDLEPFKKSLYLAKGELRGGLSSSKIGQRTTLKGTGFNYDFADEEGESRDLRNGKSIKNPKEPPIPILKVNDILVTTGMDGVFPPGFQVAIVTHIELLKEGDYFYELEAKPIASPLEELSLVFVLPPLNSSSEFREMK